MNYNESSQLVLDAAALRAQGKHDQCIKLLEDNLSQIDSDARLIALIQLFGAALGKGNDALARQTAREIAKVDPELPSIQSYL